MSLTLSLLVSTNPEDIKPHVPRRPQKFPTLICTSSISTVATIDNSSMDSRSCSTIKEEEEEEENDDDIDSVFHFIDDSDNDTPPLDLDDPFDLGKSQSILDLPGSTLNIYIDKNFVNINNSITHYTDTTEVKVQDVTKVTKVSVESDDYEDTNNDSDYILHRKHIRATCTTSMVPGAVSQMSNSITCISDENINKKKESLLDSIPRILCKFDALFPFYRLKDHDCKELSQLVLNEINQIDKIFCNAKGRILKAKIYYYCKIEPKSIEYFNDIDNDDQVSQWNDIIMDEKYCLKELGF